MSGLPATGKTTIAGALAAAIGAVHLVLDTARAGVARCVTQVRSAISGPDT